jgi:chloramphenicol-sensitive protein RarD
VDARTDDHSSKDLRLGLLYGLFAYGWWGLVPIYFKSVAHVAPLTVLSHRVVWSVFFLAIFTTVQRGWSDFCAVLRNKRTMLVLVGSTLMVSSNWLIFIYSVTYNQVLQSSLGYFISPLLFVALAVAVLRERLRGAQVVAIVIAALGVAYLVVRFGQIPWIALGVALSFVLYGLLRKLAPVSPLVGLTVETMLLLPPALVVAGIQFSYDLRASAFDMPTYALLVLAGIVTTVPLLAFAAAARRLPLATIGFLQYLAPTGQFLLAVLAYGEEFTRDHAVSFGCIWTALAIFSLGSLRRYRSRNVRGFDAKAPVTAEPLPE